MIHSLYLAYRYIRYNRVKSLILVCCVTLITFLPLSLQLLVTESEQQLMARAKTTPLLLGSKGSSLDLALNSLYFTSEMPELIDMSAAYRIDDTGFGIGVPLYVRFQAQGVPIVGTSLDYFEFRNLQVAQGRQLARLGECVLGAQAAENLQLGPGDFIVSSPENMFDLAGVYPLKMQITGVLERSHSADDLAIFTDLKTTWVIQGLGHGHQDVVAIKDPTLVMQRSESNVTASVKLYHFSEITEENYPSFHFHGDLEAYPISAVICLPDDEKGRTLLQGRFLGKEEMLQIFEPHTVIAELLQNIFRIKNVLDAIILVVSGATIASLGLVFSLSLRLRQKEVDTIFKIGCDRAMILQLLTAEIGLIIGLSVLLVLLLIGAMHFFTADLVRLLFL